MGRFPLNMTKLGAGVATALRHQGYYNLSIGDISDRIAILMTGHKMLWSDPRYPQVFAGKCPERDKDRRIIGYGAFLDPEDGCRRFNYSDMGDGLVQDWRGACIERELLGFFDACDEFVHVGTAIAKAVVGSFDRAQHFTSSEGHMRKAVADTYWRTVLRIGQYDPQEGIGLARCERNTAFLKILLYAEPRGLILLGTDEREIDPFKESDTGIVSLVPGKELEAASGGLCKASMQKVRPCGEERSFINLYVYADVPLPPPIATLTTAAAMLIA